MSTNEFPPRIEHVLNLGDGGDLPFRVSLSDEEVKQYFVNPRAVISQIAGTSVETWMEWLEARGRPMCVGTKTNGRPCKSKVPGIKLSTPQEWKNYGGGYCNVHGGG